MLKVLFRKQLYELFKSFFYDFKKGKTKTRGGIIASITLFSVVMVIILGGIFTGLSVMLCIPLVEADNGWLLFAIMGLIALVLGLFGSVFNTYASLYQAKDNELLLSMPIPVRYIIVTRLFGVYFMGALYSGIVFIPAVIVYQFVVHFSLKALIGSLLMFLVISMIVLLLSCALGWVVAKIAVKLKNKSMITVVISIAFIAAYYFFYARIVELVSDLIANAVIWGDKVKTSAYPLYLFGRMGEGDWIGLAVCIAVTAILCGLVYWIISRSFIKTALSTGSTAKVTYHEKKVKSRSADMALLAREGKRLTSSATFMLNGALGVLMVPLVAVFVAIKGRDFLPAVGEVFAQVGASPVILLTAIVILTSGMTFVSSASVSMEGKTLWLARSLPVTDKQILKAKLRLQLLLTCVPTLLYCVVCTIVMVPVLHPDVLTVILFFVLPQLFNVFYAAVLLLLGIRFAILDWTSETIAIKQNIGSLLSVLIAFGYTFVFVVPAFFLSRFIGTALYLLAASLVTVVLVVVYLRKLNTEGVENFHRL